VFSFCCCDLFPGGGAGAGIGHRSTADHVQQYRQGRRWNNALRRGLDLVARYRGTASPNGCNLRDVNGLAVSGSIRGHSRQSAADRRQQPRVTTR